MLSHTVKTIALHAAVSHAVQLEFLDIWDFNPGPIPQDAMDPFSNPWWLEDHDMMVGGEITIQCFGYGDEVTEVQCSSGTQYCYDYSEVHCPKPDPMILGGQITIQCEGDWGTVTEVQCSSGTQHCYDNSEVHCPSLDDMIVGGEITIQCEDDGGKVTEVQCNSGTQHCYDNSWVLC